MRLTSLFLLFFLSACNQANKTDTPEQTVHRFLLAISNNEDAKASKFVTDDSKGMLSLLVMTLKPIDSNTIKNIFSPQNNIVSPVIIDGNNARVEITHKKKNTHTFFYLKKIKENWLIDYDPTSIDQLILIR